jgi:hypothetical protein
MRPVERDAIIIHREARRMTRRSVSETVARCHAQVARAYTDGVGVERALREIVIGEYPSFRGEWFGILQEVEKDDWKGFSVTPDTGRRLVSFYGDPLLDSFAGTPLPVFSTEELVKACGRNVVGTPVSKTMCDVAMTTTMPMVPRRGDVGARDGCSYVVLATTENASHEVFFHDPGDNVIPAVLELIRLMSSQAPPRR